MWLLAARRWDFCAAELNLRLVAAMEKPRPFVKEPASCLSMPMETISYFFYPSPQRCFWPKSQRISCSADFPPNRMATRSFFHELTVSKDQRALLRGGPASMRGGGLAYDFLLGLAAR